MAVNPEPKEDEIDLVSPNTFQHSLIFNANTYLNAFYGARSQGLDYSVLPRMFYSASKLVRVSIKNSI